MDYNPFSLQNKTILVTGASSGIGKQIAISCSRMGATIIANGRDNDKLENTKSELCTDFGQIHAFVSAELTTDDGIKRIVDTSPLLDGVVNCAGVNTKSLVKFVNRKLLEDVFSINCFAPTLLTKGLLKNKKLSVGASIVIISSISSIYATISNCLYGSSKGAVNSLIRVMALELSSKHIRVNGIMPGIIGTEMMKAYDLSEEELDAVKRTYPLGRFGQTIDVANGVIYLLSDASNWVTGTNIIIDGGVTLR